MLVTGVYFSDIVLAVHVVFVVAAFGVLICYPVIAAAAERIDRRSVPLLLRVRVIIGRSLVNPGLLFVVAAGVYLAAHLGDWGKFYVQWGIGAALVIGALEGMFVIRRSGKLAALAQRDIDASPEGDVVWSDEYLSARTRADQVNALLAMIVVVTVYLMAVK